jgi:hypothetical protein
MRCHEDQNRRLTCGYARIAIPRISRERPPEVAAGDLRLHIPVGCRRGHFGCCPRSGTVLAGWRRVWDSNPR